MTFENSLFTTIETFKEDHKNITAVINSLEGVEWGLNYEDSLFWINDWECDYFELPAVANALTRAQPKNIKELDKAIANS